MSLLGGPSLADLAIPNLPGPDFRCCAEPIHFGHLDVHQDDIEAASFECFHCLQTVVYNLN